MSELNMRKRRSWKSDVPGTETIQTQDSGFITLCTGPCNNVQAISVRKKWAEDDGRMPVKKMRFSHPTGHRHMPMEFTTNLSAILVEDLSVALRKTKSSDDGEAPRKETRSSDEHCSDSSNGRTPPTPPEGSFSWPSSSECCMKFPEEGSGEDTGQNFGSASPEEVFKMSTSANTSRGKLTVLHKMT